MAVQDFQARQERREEARQALAKAATALLADPEGRLADLRVLDAFAADSDPVVRDPSTPGQLCCATADPAGKGSRGRVCLFS